METHATFATSMTVIAPLLILMFWLWTGVWAWEDAKRRGKSPLLVSLLVLLFAWPLGLLAWLLFRPDEGGPGGGGRKPFDINDHRVQ